MFFCNFSVSSKMYNHELIIVNAYAAACIYFIMYVSYHLVFPVFNAYMEANSFEKGALFRVGRFNRSCYNVGRNAKEWHFCYRMMSLLHFDFSALAWTQSLVRIACAHTLTCNSIRYRGCTVYFISTKDIIIVLIII